MQPGPDGMPDRGPGPLHGRTFPLFRIFLHTAHYAQSRTLVAVKVCFANQHKSALGRLARSFKDTSDDCILYYSYKAYRSHVFPTWPRHNYDGADRSLYCFYPVMFLYRSCQTRSFLSLPSTGMLQNQITAKQEIRRCQKREQTRDSPSSSPPPHSQPEDMALFLPPPVSRFT